MTPQTLMAFSPFLGLLYLAYALLQALRKKQQGFGAALLALIALAAPLAALFLVQTTETRSGLVNALTLNAVVVFVGSLIIRWIETRNPARAANRSYGMIGVGLGVLLALGTFAAPLIATVSASGAAVNTAVVNAAGANSTLRTVSNVTTDSASETAAAEALTAQTGLTSDELTTRIESGSKIADLVSAHGGNLNAVITAIASTLDELKTAGGMPAQMLSRLGDDSTAVATQLVNGELDSRAQQFLLRMLVSGNSGFLPAGQAPTTADGTPSAPGSFAPPADGTMIAPAGFSPPADGTMIAPADFAPPAGFASGGSDTQSESANPTGDTAAEAPTAQPTEVPATATATTVRPTQIVFPTATPTPAVTETSVAATSGAIMNAAVTCAIIVNYNLNLREAPNTESTVLLSIPFGSIVQADGRSAEGWYHVGYDGKSGWVSGDYVTPASTCDTLATVNGE